MKRASRTGVIAALSLLAVLVGAVIVAPPASAHTELIESTPTDGEALEALPLVALTFSGTVLDVGSEIFVTDSTGVTIQLEVTYPEATAVEATVPPLANGAVVIEWRVVAEDGHPIEGIIAVTLGAPSPSPTPTPTEVTLPAEPESPSATPVATPISAPLGEEGVAPWTWALIALAIVGSGAVVFIAAARRSGGNEWDRPEPPSDPTAPNDNAPNDNSPDDNAPR